MASHDIAAGQPGEPVAEKTLLGWACAGPIPGYLVRTKYVSHYTNMKMTTHGNEIAELS